MDGRNKSISFSKFVGCKSTNKINFIDLAEDSFFIDNAGPSDNFLLQQ